MPAEMITNVMPDRDDGVDAGLLDDVEQVRDREEVRRENPQQHAEREQARDRAEAPAGNAAHAQCQPQRGVQHALLRGVLAVEDRRRCARDA